jgi:hypothetical protein
MNPAVFSDPQVIAQPVPSRGRGRPTLYSPELIEEFCGLIVDGMTLTEASQQAGMPSRRTFGYWLEQYPEFRSRYERAVTFRNQCWMDDCVDIADAPMVEGENIAKRKLRCDMRWKQLRGAGLKVVYAEREKAQVVERDPVHAQLYSWELKYHQRRRGKEFTRSKDNGQAK